MDDVLFVDISKADYHLLENMSCCEFWQFFPPTYILEQIACFTCLHEKEIVVFGFQILIKFHHVFVSHFPHDTHFILDFIPLQLS